MNNYVMALFSSGTTNFDYMGLGPLADAISAVATETATSNGNITYTMEMDYPINGRLASQLVEGNLIKAQVSKTPGDYMIFEINETLKSDDRTITVYCDAYANRILRMSFDNGGKFGSFGNVQQALNAARAQMTGIQSDFTLSSGIGTSLNMSGVTSKNTLPTTYQDFNAYLDAIMDKVQGNVRFGVNSIQIVSDRGHDITDTVLRDDKNTNGISIKVDTSNIVNRIIPMLPVKDKDGNVTQETKVGKIVTSSVAFKFINFYAGQVVSLDTQDLANSYFNRTNCDRPTTTATVQTSMLDEDLTDIRLFDRIQVYSSKIGYQAKLKVCERAFDILAGAVSEFKLGSSSVTIFNSQTSVINAINSAVQSSQYAAITADGKNTAYYEGSNPNNPKENDLWFHSVNGINQIDQYVNGNWVTIVSDSTGEQINQKVSQLGAEAKTAVDQAKSASEKTDQLASKYDDTSSLASQAMNKAVSAQGDASSAVASANSTASEFGKVNQKADSAVASALNAQSAASDAVSAANSTASEFGKVSQKTDSAVANSLNAQSAASDAIKQASSAAADSKDAKQIAGAVSQSYKTLTDGSTMTIAELESGLAVKLTKTDLDGYATQTWTQNQVKMTADGINGTMSSIKSTVDGQTTSINDLKADSSSFKSQFTTVNNTLGKQTTDISTLQASSKELTTGFNTLTTDNATNKNDISQLRQTATELSSTMMTVQTQVQDSAVGTNLYTDTRDFENPGVWNGWSNAYKTTEKFNGLTVMGTDTDWGGLGQTIQAKKGETYTFSVYARYKSGTGNSKIYFRISNDSTNTDVGAVPVYLNETWQRFTGTATVTADGQINARIERTADNANTLLIAGPKLERGSMATDYSVSPLDNATVTAFSKLSQTVDGMKLDISKKIEQTDLNGYATQTWTQNQIKLTSDSLNATLSSVNSTVDGHTTSINDLQADSRGFKAQFTTVNNTIGKHTTDIGTLQTTSKELTTGFNTLTSDNATNKNDISQLKQTATEVSSTLETVQTQVKNSAVGTNLLTGTGSNTVTTVTGTYASGYLSNETIEDLLALFKGLEGQTVTVSVDYEYSGFIAGSSQNRLGWETKLSADTTSYFGPWHYPDNDSGSGRMSSTFVVPKNITSIVYATGYIQFSGSGTGTLSHLKLEKGSLATDWCPNPADNATVTAVSTLSQTVDGMKADISKKIEQKDLNGYATQTWAQNQINTTANGINGTISSVKSTVDGHTTSINTLKADSSGFKAQFTTVNNTLGKHTTDIGTLQASNKSLSASFDSLSSDNDTNKHNISQLQQTAEGFSSTLMTVQQQVTDSAVGTNLYRGTRDFDNPGGIWNRYDSWTKTGEIYNGMTAVSTTHDWDGLSQTWAVKKGETYTFSVYAKYESGTGNSNLYCRAIDDLTSNNTDIGSKTVSLNGTWQRVFVTFVVTADGYVCPRLERTTNNANKLIIAGPKLERGSVMTDYSTSPLDNATVTAVSSISQTVDAIQTTVRGKVDNDVYQSKVVQLSNQLTSVVGQVNSLGQKNLIANSQFQYDWQKSWGIASSVRENWYTSNFTWSWLDGYQGICANIPQNQSESWPHVQSSDVAIPDPGATAYSASVYVNIDWVETYCVLDMSFYDAAGNRTFHDTTAANKGLNFLKLENIVSPKNAVRVHIELHVHDHGHVAFIEPMLVQDSSVGKYIPDNASWTEVQQTYDSINLKVSKDGVVSAINISPESITIDGKRLHITAATYIDNAVIKDAMIANLSASKLTAGSINAANINVYNINGANIVANSISADKLQAESMLIAMNSTLQTLKVSTNGLLTTDRNGKVIGQIHTNRSVQHPENWGLDFDLNSDGKFMSWGAQNEGDPNGDYGIKFGWTRNSSASDFGMPWGGFWFNDNVMLHKNLRFDGGGVDVAGAYQLMKFAWIEMNGTHYPFFGSSNLKAGWLFGSNETYLVRGGGVINASKILGVLNGQSYKFIKSLNPDGSVKVYTDVHF